MFLKAIIFLIILYFHYLFRRAHEKFRSLISLIWISFICTSIHNGCFKLSINFRFFFFTCLILTHGLFWLGRFIWNFIIFHSLGIMYGFVLFLGSTFSTYMTPWLLRALHGFHLLSILEDYVRIGTVSSSSCT